MKIRTTQYKVDPIFPSRWSPRAMSGEPISDSQLFALFEAARWAPSAFNGQPWRFIYAKRDTEEWDELFGLLTDSNKRWVKDAAVLIVIISYDMNDFTGNPNRTHSFDTGAAWMSLALQGSIDNLAVHGMAGFDRERAREELGIPDNWTIEAMAAIGRPGRKEELPEDLQKREIRSDRIPVEQLAMPGRFRGDR